MKLLLHSVCLISSILFTNGQLYSRTAELASAYELQPQPSSVVYDPNAVDPKQLAHPEVVDNANREANLPQELLNDFYKDPRIAAALAKESWFADNEFPVFNRQAEKIPREQIAKLVKRLQHQ